MEKDKQKMNELVVKRFCSTTLSFCSVTVTTVIGFFAIVSVTLGAHSPALDTTANSLLWRLTAPNGAVSHIFGTMHLRDSTIMRQRDTVLTLLKKSRVFYGELDLDSMATAIDPSVAMLPAGKTIASLYTPEELVIIRTALRKRLGVMAPMVEVMRPPFIMAMLMMDEVESTAPYGIDEFLWEVVTQANVPRRGVESPKEQIEVLNKIPNEALLEAAKSIHEVDTMMSALIEMYSNERLSAIEELSKELSKFKDFERSINADRNTIMVDRLSKELVRGDVFIAVGALHLPGKVGMLRGFAERGFIVEPVLGGKRSSWMPAPAPPAPVAPAAKTGKKR